MDDVVMGDVLALTSSRDWDNMSSTREIFGENMFLLNDVFVFVLLL